MRRMLMAGLLVSAMGGEAFAAGKLHCSLDDSVMKMTVESGIASAGQRFFDFRGAIAFRGDVVPGNLEKIRFESKDLMQSWLRGDDLRVRAYHSAGRGDLFASIELFILAKAAGRKGSRKFDGRYTLVVDTSAAGGGLAEKEGSITCTAG